MSPELKIVLDILVVTVLWIMVPAIMVGLAVLGSWAATRADGPELKVAARAGWWAGLVLFLLYFIYTMPTSAIPSTWRQAIEIHPLAVLAGTGAGFVLVLVLHRWLSTRAIGFLVMLLAFTGTASLYSYIFLRGFNDAILSTALGLAFGVLLHVVIFPGVLKAIFGPRIVGGNSESDEAGVADAAE